MVSTPPLILTLITPSAYPTPKTLLTPTPPLIPSLLPSFPPSLVPSLIHSHPPLFVPTTPGTSGQGTRPGSAIQSRRCRLTGSPLYSGVLHFLAGMTLPDLDERIGTNMQLAGKNHS